MRSDRRTAILIVTSRALSEAVALAALAGILHAIVLGRDPIPMIATTLALFGITLILAALLRERGTTRQSVGLVAVVLLAWVAWGMAQPARSPDGVATIARLIGFGILGEVHLWRALGVARGLQRWREVRNDALFALAAVVVASLFQGPVDRDAFTVLGLAVACSGAVALSLARSQEELALSTAQVRGRQTGGSATGTAFALGILAFALALALPSLEALVAATGRILGPLVSDVLFVILLPLGYLAAYLVNVVVWIRERFIRRTPEEQTEPVQPFTPQDDTERMRQIQPYVYGTLELIVAAVVVIVALLLIARLVQERRARLTEGVTLERETVDGIGFRATLRGLFPRGAVPRRAPRDDGTPAGALRRLYWRLLEIAERDGPGWRAPAETPAEHEARLAASATRWREAGPLVRAFEALRYGERDPDPATLATARDALRRVEVAS